MRSTVTRRVVLPALVVGLVAAALPSAVASPEPGGATSAATGRATTAATAAAASDCANQPTAPYATGLPIIPCFPARPGGPTQYLDYGAIVDPTTQGVVRAKQTFDLPITVARTFLVVCNSASTTPCPPGLNLPPQDTSVTASYFGVIADVYAEADKDSNPQYGAFPVAHVTTLGFGALPTTATITIRQQVVDGVTQPLKLAWFASNGVTPGAIIPGYENYGAAPPVGPGGTKPFFTPDAHVTGTVTITVSDVAVDKVPLDVGSDCSTTTDLDLRSTGGFYYSGDTPVYPTPATETPGDYAALGAGGYLHQYEDSGADSKDKEQPAHGVDIPAFTGCVGADGQDLSALVSGLVSGPGNSVIATQVGGLVPFGCLDPTTPNCGSAHPPTYFPPKP